MISFISANVDMNSLENLQELIRLLPNTKDRDSNTQYFLCSQRALGRPSLFLFVYFMAKFEIYPIRVPIQLHTAE